jgi:mono/diheme cytochrome c family protein
MIRMLVAATCLTVLAAPSVASSQGTDEKGMQVFTAQKCNVCHSIAGKGRKNGPLDDVGSRLSAAEIRQWITDPATMAAKRQPPSTRKPPMKKKAMTTEDVDALVAMLSNLKKA